MARRGNIGINALLSASRLERAPQCSDLGFALGPRINAGGRVGKSDLGVRLLTTQDPNEAMQIADELKKALQTEDVAVIIDAAHLCVSTRGVNDTASSTLTAAYSGKFDDEATRQEFLKYVGMKPTM